MEKSTSDPVLDTDQYKSQTDELIDSMEETTALISQMADNMARLSDEFENFGDTDDRSKNIPTAQRSHPSVAAD